jgi:hypothetical protein
MKYDCSRLALILRRGVLGQSWSMHAHVRLTLHATKFLENAFKVQISKSRKRASWRGRKKRSEVDFFLIVASKSTPKRFRDCVTLLREAPP